MSQEHSTSDVTPPRKRDDITHAQVADLTISEGHDREDVFASELEVRKELLIAVDGSGDDLAVKGAELLSAVRELDDLGGAHEGEVQGVEEQNHPLALVLGQLDVTEGAVGQQRSRLELGSGLADLRVSHGRRFPSYFDSRN